MTQPLTTTQSGNPLTAGEELIELTFSAEMLGVERRVHIDPLSIVDAQAWIDWNMLQGSCDDPASRKSVAASERFRLHRDARHLASMQARCRGEM